MSDLTCPKCDAPLELDEDWKIIDKSKIGQPVGESIQGDYAHRRCLE